MESGLHTEDLVNPIMPEAEKALGALAVLASEAASKQEVERVFLPRDYQEECLEVLAEEREKGSDRALVVMASGLGKTFLAAFDVKRYLEQNGGRVLYLCHQNYILEQAREKFEAVLGEQYTYGYFHGSASKDFHEVNCLFASFQSMSSWHEAFLENEFDYIVVDESHHGQAPTYKPVLEHFKPKFMLAVTATPDRADLKDIRQIYGSEVFSLLIEQAWARGLLTPVDYRLLTDELIELGGINTPLGKLSLKELNRRLFAPRRDEEIVRIIQERSADIEEPRTIIFCPSIQYCDYLATLIPQAVPVHSGLYRDLQDYRLKLFRNGQVKTILTVDKFNEGIDVPETNIVVFLRSTASRTIFLQQLGRGLRKTEGKDKVLVLDFVANCERLVLVQDIWKKVQEQREVYQQSRQIDKDNLLNVDIGNVEFNEVVQEVIDLILAIRTGYTRELIISQLQKLAEEIGHRPKSKDIWSASKQGKLASPPTITKYFGKLSLALEAAGMVVTKKPYTKEELVIYLEKLAEELGRAPNYEDIKERSASGKGPSTGAYVSHFGSLNEALIVAGVGSVKKNYSQDELILQLQALGEKLGRTPRYKDINEHSKPGILASVSVFHLRFQGINNALKAAGFEVEERLPHTKESVIKQIQDLAQEIGRPPNTRDIDKASRTGNCASYTTLQKLFGSYGEALRAATLVVPRSNEALINHLQQLAKELGRTPRYADIGKAAKAGRPHPSTYRKRFGSIENARKLAGLSPIRYTKNGLLDRLKDTAEELGRAPTQNDLIKLSKLGNPHPGTYVRHFGSIENALKAAGIITA